MTSLRAAAEEIDEVIAARADAASERLLLEIVRATESEPRRDGHGVAPAAYETLAILYRKRNDRAREVGILERFSRQRHAPGVMPQQLLNRLARLRPNHAGRGAKTKRREKARRVLNAAKPKNWHVGRPLHDPELDEWRLYAFDPTETPRAGVRQRHWTAIRPTEVEVVREMASCLREIKAGRVPK